MNLNYAIDVNISNNDNRGLNRALSGASHEIARSYQYWTFQASFNPHKMSGFSSLISGIDSNTTITLPSKFNHDSNVSTVSSGGIKGSSDLTLSDSTGLNKGGFIKFSHNKLYLITEISGNDIKIFPSLIQDVNSNSVISENITIDVHLDTDFNLSMSLGGIMQLSTLVFEEHL